MIRQSTAIAIPRWSSAKVPTSRGYLAGLVPPSRAGLGFAHAERLSVAGCYDGVVQQPIKQGCGGGLLGQEPAPVLERVVGRESDGGRVRSRRR